nr:hypothetical protein [Pseudenhygromyxa sp. WMMC2535]
MDANEVCDDGNGAEGDGCDNDCTRTEILDIVAGSSHTCALIERGRVRCWGYGVTGQLGYGATESVGDNESPADVGDLPLPPVVAISAGGLHTCAVIEDGGVRCWGFNGTGQLGYGNTETLGDDEGLAELGEVSLGGLTSGLALGAAHSCARIEGEARCWGLNGSGQLGLGNTAPVGDNEQPSSVAPIFLGGEVASLSAGGNSTCALLVGGAVRCWGENGSGQLGYGGTKDIGDDETPGNVVALSLIPAGQPEGTTVSRLSMALEYSCALLSSGAVLCWGNNDEAQLGQGNQDSWGDGPDELPSALEPIDLGTAAVGLATGYEHSCALLDSGALRCWGNNDTGQLGLGHEELIGDDEVPGDVGPVSLGRGVIDVTVGGAHTCVVLDNHRVMCWGSNQFGQLGYGFSHNVGDNELPTAAGTVDLL